jgi:ankyrin repeat protein
MMGYTPLHLAVKSADYLRSNRMVRILLIKGANRNLRDHRGRRPIDIAKNECKNKAL